MTNIESLIDEFTKRLLGILESETLERARHAVETALGVRRPGRPSKLSAITLGGKPRKKPPKQLCPVPGCRNAAAPVLGMVCSAHKNVPKVKIKKYREARRAAKLAAKSKAAPARLKAQKRRGPVRKPVKAAKTAKRAAPKKTVRRRKPTKQTAPKAALKTAPAATPPAAPAAAA
jgi:hypothetical protein